MTTYRYLAKVERLGDMWRGSIPGMPVEVVTSRLAQLTNRLTPVLAAYLGIDETLIEVDFDVPGANRPTAQQNAARRWRRITEVGQWAGGLTALAGVASVAGTGVAAIVGGLALAAVCVVSEMGIRPARAKAGS